MSTNTAIKTWQERYNENGGSVEDCANAEIAELRAVLEKSAEELEEWRFTNKVDELQRENERLRAALEAANHRIEDLTTAANRCINDALGMAGAAQQVDGGLRPLPVWTLSPTMGVMVNDSPRGHTRKQFYAVEDVASAIAQRAGSEKDVAVQRLRDHLEDAKELIQKMMKQEANPYGYCWYNEHMEYRFTRLPPNPANCVIGEIKPVFERSPAMQPDSERDAALKKAVHVWWIGKRPCAWDEQKHAENYGVNCQGDAEYALAAMAAQQNNKGG